MAIINITCAEIQSDVGFLYVILPVLLNHTSDPDCEQSWYSQGGLMIADPSNPQKLIDPVISVSSDHLVTSLCLNLNHEIVCHSAGFRLDTVFRARNESRVTPNSNDLNEASLQLSDQLWWLFVLFIILFIIIMCFLLHKRIFRCFLRAEMNPENKDPESGVEMKFRSGDPCSLNESESVQLHV